MKMKLGFALLLLAGIVSCSSVEEKMVTSLLRDYLSAQQALAADDEKTAREALRALAEETEGAIKSGALTALQAEDLEAARNAFKDISEQVIKLELPNGYVVAFCPMADEGKGASWVQKEGEIANPYFGEKMLKCGTVTRKGGVGQP